MVPLRVGSAPCYTGDKMHPDELRKRIDEVRARQAERARVGIPAGVIPGPPRSLPIEGTRREIRRHTHQGSSSGACACAYFLRRVICDKSGRLADWNCNVEHF